MMVLFYSQRCSRELGHWETLNDFGKSQNGASPFLGKRSCQATYKNDLPQPNKDFLIHTHLHTLCTYTHMHACTHTHARMHTHTHTHTHTVLENAWCVHDWTAMKEASTQAEPICSENYSAKLNLLRGFLALCYPDEQRLSAVEKLIEAASIQSIKQWRRLPKIVSHAHIPLLQVEM